MNTAALQKFFPRTTERQLQWLALFVFASCLFSLAFAYIAQYGFGLRPCILCLYQRWPYRIGLGIGVMAYILAPKAARGVWNLLAVMVPTFFAGAGIALFQVGVEQHWWQGTEECTGPSITGMTPAELLEKLNAAPVVRCDEIQFELFGISMAGYNGLLSLGLAGFMVIALGAICCAFKGRRYP